MKNIVIKEYTNIVLDEILKLYESVGWKNYTENSEMLKNAFENSLKIFAAFDEKKLIGFIRVVGDGFSIIYIQDLLVLPEYQGKKIGSMLINKVNEAYKNVYQKVLLTNKDEKSIKFYESNGFKQTSKINCVSFIKIDL